MKEYYVTITFLETVEAADENDAERIVKNWIYDGLLIPNDIEIEEKI